MKNSDLQVQCITAHPRSVTRPRMMCSTATRYNSAREHCNHGTFQTLSTIKSQYIPTIVNMEILSCKYIMNILHYNLGVPLTRPRMMRTTVMRYNRVNLHCKHIANTEHSRDIVNMKNIDRKITIKEGPLWWGQLGLSLSKHAGFVWQAELNFLEMVCALNCACTWWVQVEEMFQTVSHKTAELAPIRECHISMMNTLDFKPWNLKFQLMPILLYANSLHTVKCCTKSDSKVTPTS